MRRKPGQFCAILWLACIGNGSATAQSSDPLLESLPAPSIEANASDERRARGVLRARHQAVLSSELAGRILEMPYSDGESFSKDDVLVRFDCSAYQAQLNAAQAAVRATREELKHQKQLAALNSVGRFEVALAEAHHAQAQAQSRVYQVQVRNCAVSAPFDGQVVQREVQPHESVASGAPLLEIVDNRTLEVQLLVPSSWIGWLQPGQRFAFVPDETGHPLSVEVKRLGARIDEGSQTLRLIGTLAPDTTGLLAGMSGSARFAEVQ